MPEVVSPGIGRQRLSLERVCQAIVLVAGGWCAFSGRNLPVAADGLAYLDVARAYVRQDWHTAVNGYWSPLYAWLLAVGMRFFQPGIRSEFTLARTLNFALFTTALYMFSGYWRAISHWSRRTSDGEVAIPIACPLVWIVLGYLLFMLNFTWAVVRVNPDILVATTVFAVAASLFRLNNGQSCGIGGYVWLGLLLAIGYYSKTILLYFAGFVLGAMVVQGLRKGKLGKPIISVLVFVALVSPFVAILSRTVGHFTTGESGRLNYAWFVNGPETKTWMTDSHGGAPLPFYPGPVLMDSPRVFHLPLIAGVTYAPWYDPSRFDKSSHPIFDWRDQFRQFAINLGYLKEQVLGTGSALSVPWLILVWYNPRTSLRRFAATWFCTLPAAAVVGMYLLVHLVQRFLLGFSLVLCGVAWASVSLPSALRLLARRALLAGTVVSAAYVVPGLLHSVVSRPTESSRRDMVIAEAVSRYGVVPGERVANIGDGQTAYWAQLVRVSVVAEIWSIDADKFWSASPEAQQAALRSMADSGAKAAVWRKDLDQPCPPQWLSLPEDSGCLVLLR